MIRFACPECGKKCKAPASATGKRATCPRCGAQIEVPSGFAAPSSPTQPPRREELTAELTCQDCGRRFGVPQDQVGTGRPVICPHCGRPFTGRPRYMPPPAPPPVRQQPAPDPFDFSHSETSSSSDSGSFDGLDDDSAPEPTRSDGGQLKHSGLGIASFLIAFLVGGLDVLLVLVVSLGIARAGHRMAKDKDSYPFRAEVVEGVTAVVCLNCMNIPLCLVGVGLALVGLIAHRKQNHLFTWIGLMGNGVVILCMLGLAVLGALSPD